MLASTARTTSPFSSGSMLHVEYTTTPPGRTRSSAAAQQAASAAVPVRADPRASAASAPPAGGPARRCCCTAHPPAPRRTGPAGDSSLVSRLDQPSADTTQPQPAGQRLDRLQPALVHVAGEDLALVAHQLGQVRRLASRGRAQVEDAASPAAGPGRSPRPWPTRPARKTSPAHSRAAPGLLRFRRRRTACGCSPGVGRDPASRQGRPGRRCARSAAGCSAASAERGRRTRSPAAGTPRPVAAAASGGQPQAAG